MGSLILLPVPVEAFNIFYNPKKLEIDKRHCSILGYGLASKKREVGEASMQDDEHIRIVALIKITEDSRLKQVDVGDLYIK